MLIKHSDWHLAQSINVSMVVIIIIMIIIIEICFLKIIF